MKRKYYFGFLLFLYSLPNLYARLGGGGGRSRRSSSRSSGSSWSSSGHSYSGHSSGSGGSSSISPVVIIIFIVICIVVYFYLKKKFPNMFGNTLTDNNQNFVDEYTDVPLPDGLDKKKLTFAFSEMQKAWQNKDLKNVRKWMSDGMYQRLHTQISIMNTLSQRNELSNLRIENIRVADLRKDNGYDVTDIEFIFSVRDKFISEIYPKFNEDYDEENIVEYWTLIRKQNVESKDLYTSNNCPNCGDVLSDDLGEISRCSSCGTLVNNAAYDWILCEITQEDDYEGEQDVLLDQKFLSLFTHDKEFAVQKMEDIASNIFMQIMEVFSGGKIDKLDKFSDENTLSQLISMKNSYNGIIFNRLYTNFVTLDDYSVEGNIIDLKFKISATYSEVKLANNTIQKVNELETQEFYMTLSRNKDAVLPLEISYSHECPNCAAPYDDTTLDKCSYCGSPFVDKSKNWVLTHFE